MIESSRTNQLKNFSKYILVYNIVIETLNEDLRFFKKTHSNENNVKDYAILGYNSSIHSTTGHTPVELVFGHTKVQAKSLLQNKFIPIITKLTNISTIYQNVQHSKHYRSKYARKNISLISPLNYTKEYHKNTQKKYISLDYL